MRVSKRARAARWSGAVLVALAPLPWLGIGTAVAVGPPGNNGTLKVHEQGTPSGFEDNDPKVCVFNFEGFSFDVGQTGYIVIDGQGQTSGSYGPISFGPTDVNGFYATSYVNDGGLAVPDGHYKATLYGKDVPQDDAQGQPGDDEVKAKSKVFKVICDEPEPSETESTPTPTTTKPTPTDTESSSSATPTTTKPTPTDTESSSSATPTTTKPTPTDTESSSSATPTTTKPTPTDTESSSSATPTTTKPTFTETGGSTPANTETSGPRSPEVEATRLTQPATLPKTGADLPIGAALAASLLFVGLGLLLLIGPGRLATERYSRKH